MSFIIVVFSPLLCGAVTVLRRCFEILTEVLGWIEGQNRNQVKIGNPASARAFGLYMLNIKVKVTKKIAKM